MTMMTTLGSVTGTSGTQYDFTNMTNSQALSAARKLGGEGKISSGDEMQLIAMASDGGSLSAPLNPATQPNWIADNLSSTTRHNYVDSTAAQLASDNSHGMALEASVDGALLKDLTAYQKSVGLTAYHGTAESANGSPAPAGGLISTAA